MVGPEGTTMRFFQRKNRMQRVLAKTPMRMPDKRAAPGASATLSNVGPERGQAIEDEDMHIYEGTSSGMGLHRAPRAGSREGQTR